MAALTKDALLKRNATLTREIELSGGDTVYVKPLPASLFVGTEDGKGRDGGDTDMALLMAQSLCDGEGVPLFGEGEREQVLSLSLSDFTAISAAILDLNGLKTGIGTGASAAEKN